MYHLFALLPPDTDTPPSPPATPALATLAPNLQVFGSRARASTTGNLRILFPPSGAVLQVTDGDGTDPVSLEATGGLPPYRWVINGTMLPPPPVGMSMLWQPGGAGFAHISILDGRDDAVSEDIALR
jgi:penicillin-binding protein 1C